MKLQKAIAMIALLCSFAMAVVAVGNFKVQYPSGTDVFTVDNVGNVDADGLIKEQNVYLHSRYLNKTDNASMWASVVALDKQTNTTLFGVIDASYWNALTDMVLTQNYIYVGDGSNDPVGVAMSGHATISSTGVVTVVSTSGLSKDNITNFATEVQTAELDADHDECSEITNCVPNAWDALGDMVLANGNIYIGDVSNDPAAQAITGDITLSNAGVVAVVDTAGLNYHNVTIGMPTCSGTDKLVFDGTDLSCETDEGGADVYLNSTVAGVETAIGVYNYTTGSTIALSGGSRITGANKAGSNVTIDSNGNVIIVLA